MTVLYGRCGTGTMHATVTDRGHPDGYHLSLCTSNWLWNPQSSLDVPNDLCGNCKRTKALLAAAARAEIRPITTYRGRAR